jgi:serine/threonine protein kinase
VFRAEWNGTAVAVKSLLEFSHSQLESFVKEMQVLARLRHPNVLMILGMVLEQRHQCLVSEFCSGGSLHGYIHGHRLSWENKIHIARQVAAAMEYLHSQSVLHRDLKVSCLHSFLFVSRSFSARQHSSNCRDAVCACV